MVRSFHRDFEALCEKNKERIAVYDLNHSLSYQELSLKVQTCRANLENQGLKARDSILVFSENSKELAILLLSCLQSGIDICPANPKLTEEEIKLCEDYVQPKFVITDKERENIFSSKSKISIFEFFKDTPSQNLSASNVGRILIFTSGTTAAPKIIVINGDSHWTAANLWVKHHDFLNSNSIFWNYFPMSYNAGILNLLLIPLAAEGTVLITESFSVKTIFKFFEYIEKFKINILWFNPTILRTLHKVAGTNSAIKKIKDQVKASFIGMAPITEEEKVFFQNWLQIPIYENYALTEIQFLTSEYPLEETRSVGKILPWVKIKFEDLEEDVGEIHVQADTMVEGYLGPHQQLFPLSIHNGFLITGDRGKIDPFTQNLILKGRSKDIIKKGGLIVDFRELEELALSSPFVAEAVTIPVDDTFYGENTVVCVTLKDNKDTDQLKTLERLFRDKLAKFKWPKRIIIMEQFPKTVSGKNIRRQVAENFHQKRFVIASSEDFN